MECKTPINVLRKRIAVFATVSLFFGYFTVVGISVLAPRLMVGLVFTVFARMTVLNVFQFLSENPEVILNEDGIEWRAARWAFIPWSETKAVWIDSNAGCPNLVLQVEDPGKYVVIPWWVTLMKGLCWLPGKIADERDNRLRIPFLELNPDIFEVRNYIEEKVGITVLPLVPTSSWRTFLAFLVALLIVCGLLIAFLLFCAFFT
jgi:hypothetical protein